MKQQKKWHLYLIIAVIVLTIYNILPTVFFYSKPLKSPVDAKRSHRVAEEMIARVNRLEPQAQEWLDSFCKLLKLKPQSIEIDPANAQLVSIHFKNIEEAQKFRQFLPRAGALIPFVPAQLSLYDTENTLDKKVTVQRRIPLHFDVSQLDHYTQFSEKFDQNHAPTPLYKALTEDRAMQVAIALTGPSQNALLVQALSEEKEKALSEQFTKELAQNILSFVRVYPENAEISERYFASFTQIANQNREVLVDKLIHHLQVAKEEEAARIVERNRNAFIQGKAPLSPSTFAKLLQTPSYQQQQLISLEGRNPFVDALAIDWTHDKIRLILNPTVATVRAKLDNLPGNESPKDLLDQLLYNEIAFVSRQTDEKITPNNKNFEIALSQLEHSNSFLALRLSSIVSAEVKHVEQTLNTLWSPNHPDLTRESFPIYDYETYQQLPASEKEFGLVIYAPALSREVPAQGFQMNAVYVIARGMDAFLERLKKEGDSEHSKQFIQDFNQLRDLLQRNGFMGYSGSAYSLAPEFAKDFIFEIKDYYQTVLKATREDFATYGTKRFAILEYTDVEQRILTENKIDNRIHEDLLKWRDDYYAAQVGVRGVSKYDVPKPVSNVFWNNLKLSFVKYFRGDDRKILHWGLDLSGGKTVHIELRDSAHQVVTNEADIKQGINELYARVNKMGLSEVSIRQEGNFITLDFPGSQALSAGELVKASSMYFHVVNEKFGPNNPLLANAAERFLQDVWNEAVVTNRKDSESIAQIAWKQLHGDSLDLNVMQPRSESARLLYENGLRLTPPQETEPPTSAFNDVFSKIAIFRGDDFTDWYGQTHPLIFVFRNFALEGANLENVQASYDPSKGNYLAFSVQSSSVSRQGTKIYPADGLYAWTEKFAKEKITGTPLEAFSHGRGWRMAVILNGSVISAPTLDSALRDSAMISGSFTQREITKLEADLKAGSLSFTPHILSEKNVSPELGAKERLSGVIATIISLLLVMGVMTLYYRFAGAIAACALFFNLLLMWAILQNLEATMTLAGIAGIILTLGMAVDANVLVFERIREEFAVSSRIASAVHAGYRKAFSAILDSNVTTIIAALILLQFDSGPVKAFAVMLIVGILSSFFTALFLTRFFFARWVQNPNNRTLKMNNWFKAKSYDFLKQTKKAALFSIVVILLGSAAFIATRHTIFGMDFSGGYALNVELQTVNNINYPQGVEQALINQGAHPQEFQVRELSPSNHLRIFFSKSLEQPGHPFFGMPLENALKEPLYTYQLNPKIVWTVHALEQAGLSLEPTSLPLLDSSWTQVSGQLSDIMRNSALIGLALAMLAILIYIAIRFEFKYAISATLCTIHDVIFTVATLAILVALGVNIQIDLNTVAALMTIVGYSLNDTIIVFDRIREDVRLMHKASFKEIINHALNVTLSRTMMTSGTTLLVLIPLILFGGTTLFGFSLVMAIGVIFGTLSSLFLAAPLMKYFNDKEKQKESRDLSAF